MSPGLVILSATAVFAVLLLFLKWVLDKSWSHAGKTIENRHRTAYRILESGKIPQKWLPKKLRNFPIPELGTQELERARQSGLRHLAGEIQYFDNVAPFENEEAKRIFMHSIRSVEKSWTETPVEDVRNIIDVQLEDDSQHMPGTPYRS